jgi:hypothetical protein
VIGENAFDVSNAVETGTSAELDGRYPESVDFAIGYVEDKELIQPRDVAGLKFELELDTLGTKELY